MTESKTLAERVAEQCRLSQTRGHFPEGDVFAEFVLAADEVRLVATDIPNMASRYDDALAALAKALRVEA